MYKLHTYSKQQQNVTSEFSRTETNKDLLKTTKDLLKTGTKDLLKTDTKTQQRLTSEFSGVFERSCGGAVDQLSARQTNRAVLPKVSLAALELLGGDAHVSH